MSKALVKKILKAANGIGYMATVDGAQPRVRPMACNLTPDNLLWMSTFTRSPKMKQLAKNPRVELCFSDPAWQQLRIAGRVKVVTAAASKAAFFKKNPDLKQYFTGADDPNFVMLELKPASVKVMAGGSMEYTDVKL